ncbi:MAG: WG repeat-containing protein [Flavobacteriales bacterium]|nr:WG repeat-containing protein [Flavobacteriales bacterium]MCB9447507.1 WG repeat-containing protein [Flavobacteriales bacterium]
MHRKLKRILLSIHGIGQGGVGMVLLVCMLFVVSCSTRQGFESLQVYNYFKARHTFKKGLSRNQAAAGYGLACIYLRNDNPFHDLDSSFWYVTMSEQAYAILKPSKREKWRDLLDSARIDSVKQNIYGAAFIRAVQAGDEAIYNHFLEFYVGAPQYDLAVKRRNTVAFSRARAQNTSDAMFRFLDRYPDAQEAEEANDIYQALLYKEHTESGTVDAYVGFIRDFPESPYVREAQNTIFALETESGKASDYYGFIRQYPSNPNVSAAWHNLYQLNVVDYKPETIAKFLEMYPDYPFRNQVEQELELSQTTLFAIRSQGKWGYADSTGKVLVPCQFEWVADFAEGLAMAGRHGKVGFINKHGYTVVSFQYEEAESFKDGYALVYDGTHYGFVERTGRVVIPLEYDQLNEFSEGLAAAQKEDAYGFIDRKGKVVIPFVFDQAGDFSEGLARVVSDGKTGYVNTSGELVIPCQLQWGEPFHDGLARVRSMDEFGVMDPAGHWRLRPEYDLVGNFSNNRALVVQEGHLGYVNRKGEVMIPVTAEADVDVANWAGFQHGKAKSKKGKGWGMIDTAGRVVVPRDYEDLGYYQCGLLPAKKRGKWGYLNHKLRVMVPYQYDRAYSFAEGMARVEKKGMVGFIDSLGREIIPVEFEEAGLIRNGCVFVSRGGKWGCMVEGAWALPLQYSKLEFTSSATIIRVQKGTVMGYFDVCDFKWVWKEDGFDQTEPAKP